MLPARNFRRRQSCVNYLAQALREQDYLICLDDYQFVEDDPYSISSLAASATQRGAVG